MEPIGGRSTAEDEIERSIVREGSAVLGLLFGRELIRSRLVVARFRNEAVVSQVVRGQAEIRWQIRDEPDSPK